MPGSGKSTIGRHLARSLHLGFIDADTEIERLIGCPIRDYFEREGEEPFRAVEEGVLRDLVQRPDSVLATGGGAVLRSANRELLREASSVIYLHSSPAAIFRRLRHDRRRPLLQVSDPLSVLHKLHEDRDSLYRETAHFVVETGRPTVANVVGLILMQLEMASLGDRSATP